MSLATASETIATGGVIATSIVGSKEHQVVMTAGADGHIIGSRPDFLLWFPPAANAANRIVGDLYNAGTIPVRVRGLWMMPTFTAITGAPIDWIVQRTSAIGTGGTAITPQIAEIGTGTWPVNSSARSSPTGGATAGATFFNIYTLNEETNAAFGILPYTNQLPQLGDRMFEIVLKQNEGMAVRQSAVANAVGLTGMLLLATYDN